MADTKSDLKGDEKILQEAKDRPSVALLQALLVYDPESGQLTWRRSLRSRVIAGRLAGIRHPSGYIRVGINNKRYPAHSIAWAMVHGTWQPDGLQIDHKNGDGFDNRLCNLRLATPTQNQANRRGRLKGVRLHSCGRWEARITMNGKAENLGLHRSPELAKAAYDRRAVELFGEFARP